MPIYEYVCNECGESFEKRVSFSEADTTPNCPNCASSHTRKMISQVGSLGGSITGSSSSTSSCGSSGGFS